MWRHVRWYRFTDIVQEPATSLLYAEERGNKQKHLCYIFPYFLLLRCNYLRIMSFVCQTGGWVSLMTVRYCLFLLTLCRNQLPLSSTLKREATSKHIYVIYVLNSFYSVVITCVSWASCARQADRSPSWQCGTVCSNHVLSENSDCCRLSLRQDSTSAPTWRWICLAAPNSNGTWSREQVGEKCS